MKNILVAENRTDLLDTLEPILKHWGYRVLSTSKAGQVGTFLKESEPCLLIIGEELLGAKELAVDKGCADRTLSGNLPVIAVRQEGAGAAQLPATETIEPPLDLFELFSFIQQKVEKHPRQNLRLRLRLPGMFSLQDCGYILAEVMSLSMCGLFFKAAARVRPGDQVSVIFPLLGQGKEIEVAAKVLYAIHPDASNNFFQGFGVGFSDLPAEHEQHLRHYIREHFIREVSSQQAGVGDFAFGQLRD